MKIKIWLKEGFDVTHVPLPFRAFWNDEGACYMRTRVCNGKIIFFCAQLLNYHNTSVTNALESVREAAFNQLLRDGGVRFTHQKSFVDRFRSSERIDEDIFQQVFQFIENNSTWIEYYPPEFASWLSCNYSEVRFNERGYPVWLHRPLNQLETLFPGVDFTVSSSVLAGWNDTMTSESIKILLRDKNWLLKQVAERWELSEKYVSRIVNNAERDKHWEDAFRGLPARTERERAQNEELPEV